MASITTLIRDIPQWQLFQSVLPVFKSELKWEPHDPEPSNNSSVNDSVKLLQSYLSEIPFYVNAEDELPDIYHAVFVSIAGTLLSTMQEMVDLNIPQNFDDDTDLDQNSFYSDTQLRQGWPRLLSLAYLLDNNQEWTSYIVLRQDPSVFKKLQGQAEVFVKSLKTIVPDRAIQTAKALEEPSRSRDPQHHDHASQINQPFREYSRHMFTAIVRHIRRLAECTATHRALLHLKGPSDAHDSDHEPELSMFMTCCPNQDTWQHVVCSEYVASLGASSEESVDDICELTRYCFEGGCILKVELKGDTLVNKSDEVEEMKPSMLDNSSLTEFTLGELLRRGIFREGYRVFPNDKKILAYILARALLCLYDGPWLQTPWTADKLVFRYDADAKTIYNVHQPYISCDMLEDPPPVVSRNPMHQYPPILAFAKLLVDLNQGSVDGETDIRKPALLKYVKTYYAEERDNNLSPAYAMALHSSIFFNQYLKKIQGKDPKATAQDAILEGIVKPLGRDVHMDKKNEWGRRNVSLENNTFIMARPTTAMDQPVPAPEPPRLQEVSTTSSTPSRPKENTTTHSRSARNEYNGFGRGTKRPTETLSTRPQAGSHLTANKTVGRVSPTSPRSRPASRSVSPSGPPAPRTAMTSVAPTESRSFMRHDVILNMPTVTSRTIGAQHTKRSYGNTNKSTASVGSCIHQKVPQVRVNGEHASFEHGHRTPSPDGELDFAEGTFGACMFSISSSNNTPSRITFENMNAKVEEYLQHTEDDTPIKVAVVDTGIDLGHVDFERARTRKFRGTAGDEPNPTKNELPQKNRIRGYRNFCKDQSEDDVTDLDGHGTQVAGIILRLAPNAELYIARVCTGDINYGLEDDKKRKKSPGMVTKPEPEAVQEAIAWAINEGVDIINLSLGYRNANVAQFREFVAMLRNTDNTIIFAATANQGAHDKVAWPANDRSAAIGIHSSCDSGMSISNFSARPLSDNDNFMTVGENILSQWPMHKGGGFRLCSGTSFATPVAAAVGALILAFAQQDGQIRFRKEKSQVVNLEELHTTDGMRKVLRQISTKDNNDYRWIHSKLFWRDCRDGTEPEIAFKHAWAIIEKALDM